MQHIHLIGIGGTGLSAIAKVLKESGYQVSGSDQVISPLAANLQQMGIQVFTGHRAENIIGADIVVQSSAVHPENPEIRAAIETGIPVLKRSDFLGRLLQGKSSIAIAGTHGKTTTTAMISWMLEKLGRDPSFIVGSIIKGLNTNAHAGKGAEFVIEADEYDRMFLGLKPRIGVVTYLEHDHPDCYPTYTDYLTAFQDFVATIQPGGTLLVSGDQPDPLRLLKNLPAHVNGYSYGLHPGCDFQVCDSRIENGTYAFRFVQNTVSGTKELAKYVHLTVPGQHNVQNAAAALAVAELLSLDGNEAARHLDSFCGSGRRFEVVGEIHGITLIDDYAHHPTEIAATLAAARSRYPLQRIWAVWQPHTYSRTRLLHSEFAQAFSQADEVVITEIYASRENVENTSSAEVAQEVPGGKARFAATLTDASHLLLNNLQPGDIVVVLSAGDADQINRQLLQQLSERTF